MSRRFLILMGSIFVICVAVMIAAAFHFGADPFHERSRHIWALTLIAAAYVAFRIAMIVDRYLEHKELQEGVSYWSGLPIFGRRDHAIDKRMAKRRARVEAARKRDKDSEDITKETGDE
ncbi:MAG: hypothetical protein AAFR51_05990 [Pseudomonadota bacterium]